MWGTKHVEKVPLLAHLHFNQMQQLHNPLKLVNRGYFSCWWTHGELQGKMDCKILTDYIVPPPYFQIGFEYYSTYFSFPPLNIIMKWFKKRKMYFTSICEFRCWINVYILIIWEWKLPYNFTWKIFVLQNLFCIWKLKLIVQIEICC